MTYNQALKDSLEQLTQNVFAFYNGLVNPDLVDSTTLFIMLHRLEEAIKQMKEFSNCVDLMNADATMCSLIGKMVGTLTGGGATVGSADACIMGFIYQLYQQNKTFDLALFNERYGRFEEFFHSDGIRFVDTIRLHNFEMEADEVELEKGVVIKRLPPVQNMYEIQYRPHIQISKSDFVIERKYVKPKLVGNFPTDISPKQIQELTESGDIADLIVKTLRLFKTSAVFRDKAIVTESITFSMYGGVMSRGAFNETIIMGNKCSLSTQEVDEVKILFEKLKKIDNPTFKIASNRLGFGVERQLDEDKLLDFMIGLEALYLPDGNDELTFRLSLRVAFMLAQDPTERKELFQSMKKMYGLRSHIAHGKKNTLTKEVIIKLEEMLRASLRKYLDNPDNFDGKNLNDIFFK